jgi:hypothetical protein
MQVFRNRYSSKTLPNTVVYVHRPNYSGGYAQKFESSLSNKSRPCFRANNITSTHTHTHTQEKKKEEREGRRGKGGKGETGRKEGRKDRRKEGREKEPL